MSPWEEERLAQAEKRKGERAAALREFEAAKADAAQAMKTYDEAVLRMKRAIKAVAELEDDFGAEE